MSEDRLGHVKNRLERINDVLDQLRELADTDEVITPDEQDILHNVKKNITKYKELANKLMQDQSISDDDLERLYIFEKKIVQDASSAALDDGRITGDEGDLLQKLINFFEEMNDINL